MKSIFTRFLCVFVLVTISISYSLAQGETCATAISITSIPFSYNGSTCGSGDDYFVDDAVDGTGTPTGNPNLCDYPGPFGGIGQNDYLGGEDLVFEFTPTTDDCYTLFMPSSAGNHRTTFHVFGTCPDDPVAVCLGMSSITYYSASAQADAMDVVTLTAGETYYIVVSGETGCTSDFDLTIEGTTGNDLCENSIPLSEEGNNNFAATNCNEPNDWAPENYPGIDCPGGEWLSNENGVWYTFEVTASTEQPVSLSIVNIDCVIGDLQLGIWGDTGDCTLSAGTFIGCDVGSGTLTVGPNNLALGDYFVYVDGHAGSNCTWGFVSNELFCDIGDPTANSYGPYCSGETITSSISATPSDAANDLNWYDGDPENGGTLIGTGTSIPTPSYISSTAGTYEIWLVESVSGEDCESSPQQIIIQVLDDMNTATAITASPGTELGCTTGTITLDAGLGFNGYEWSANAGNATTQTVDISTAGTYSVTVTDINGCTGTSDIIITSDSSTPNAIITPSDTELNCNITSINLDGSSSTGTGILSYEWSNASTADNITVTTAGTYTLTITDANGCTAITTQGILEAEEPVAIIVPEGTTLSCTTTSLNLDASTSTGVAPLSFEWSNTSSINNITVNIADTYTVTITDGNGCTATTDVTINGNSTEPTTTITASPGTELTCVIGTITLDAGIGFNGYEWSANAGNANTQTVDVSTAGTYTVIVTDINGCTGTSDIIITSSSSTPNAIIVPSDTELNCNITSINLDGSSSTGTGILSYEWSNASTADNITVTAAGTYTLTITDANGCTAITTQGILEAEEPVAIIVPEGTTLSCTTTSLNLDASTSTGVAPLSFEWSNTLSINNITVNTADTYTVTITDGNGCTATTDVTINGNSTAPTTTITASPGTELTCTIETITLDAGLGFNAYEWSANAGNANTQTVDVSAAGTYTVIVTDINGCTGTSDIVITSSSSTSNAIIVPSDLELNCNITSINLDGSSSTGTGILSYEWSNSSTADNITVTTAGTYTLTITDANGCTAITTQGILEAEEPVAIIVPEGTTLSCTTTSLNLDASTSTGVAPLSFEWSNTSSINNITVNTADTYTVTITDGNGCTATTDVTINGNVVQPTTVEITGNLTICPNESTTLDAGGNYDSYLWTGGSTGQTLTVNTPGEYIVIVANGTCTATDTVNVVALNAAIPTITGNTNICNGEMATLEAGAGYASYEWSNLETSQGITVTDAGIYTVTVTNNDGCTGSESIEVNVGDEPDYGVVDGLKICFGESITIGTVAAAGTTYSWTSDPVDPSLVNPTTGTPEVSPTAPSTTYYLTATNGFCTTIDSVTIEIVEPNITVNDVVVCEGETDILTATVSPAGGSITWYDSEGNAIWIGETLEVDPTESTFYDAVYVFEGCSDTSTATVTLVEDVDIEIVSDSGNEIEAGTDATLTVVEAPAGSSFEWTASDGSNPTGDESIVVSPSEAITYTVTITTPEGCTYTTTFTLTIAPPEFPYYIPNIFTPNGDDLNDTFGVLYDPSTLTVIEFKIFDRWGELVHDDESTHWDGTFNGKRMPSDVYVYFIKLEFANGDIEFDKGDVTLIR